MRKPTEPSKKQIKVFKQKIKSLEEWHKSRREKLEDKKREIAFLGVFGFSRQLEELERERVSKLEIIDVPKASKELEQALKEQQEELETLEEERQNLLDKKESLQKEYESLISIEN